MTSLIDALNDSAKANAGQPAIVMPNGAISHGEFAIQSDRVAAGLAERGIQLGDRVAIYLPNGPEFAVVYGGIIKAGAVVVPVNLLINTEEITYILNDAEVAALCFDESLAATVEKVSKDVPSLRFCVQVGGAAADELISFAALKDSKAPTPQPAIDASNDLAAILYTSGTTGFPKGAMLTHANLVSNTRSVHAAMRWRSGVDVVLVVLPMFHAFAATVGMLTPLTQGCAFVPLVRFDPEVVADAILHHGATIFLGVPSMYSVMLRLRDDKVGHLASLRCCIAGGAAMPVEVLRRFESRFGVRVYEGDGPTECSPVTCVNPVEGLTKPGTVGLPVPEVEMKIVDDQGLVLPDGVVGEIAVRGPSVMKGYWRQEQATAEVFRDGWFLTGDLGTRDEEGYFSIVDRKKDLIIVNGMNVYPRMIEEVLQRFPGVREVAVVGELSDLHGEIPVAFMALNESADSSETALRAFCRQHLGRHQVPRRFIVLPELPKNATGKIMKRELRKHGEVERGITGLI